MNILIDIKHPAQLNLFKNLSKELKEEGWEVTICYLERGKLPKIIQAEYNDFDPIAVGSSKGTKWSIIWNGNLKRTFNFLNLIKKHRFDICIAASSIPLAVACRLTRTPIIQFYDDPERKGVNRLNEIFSDKLFFPPIVPKNNKVSTFDCLKEWSYLSPKRFRPSTKILEEYGLKPHEYVFVREVSNKSFNYYGQEEGIIQKMSNDIPSNTKVVLSLEDKSQIKKYPHHWQLLQEPVGDIHSLIYYSKLLISSGDSMAREGAMLGVPSVYCGFRKMKANELLMDKGILKHLPGETAIPWISDILNKKFDQNQQDNQRSQLQENWCDMVEFMKEQIHHFKKTKK
ncbi:DUF354 domain-containing protein [Echinicola jeungdonensis]|uniref:DUF354 domain-containing protein n=1 Tax=Echinicola jeungdonensis TaxID=709343 RepID=A0ABV5J1Q7_9BACT|nr:DUF354 domain-containing protein [Echinicola jeungdonensis]MDN3671156.1 DUF354 domain-containing protein [Echinicola jeungdonensis]